VITVDPNTHRCGPWRSFFPNEASAGSPSSTLDTVASDDELALGYVKSHGRKVKILWGPSIARVDRLSAANHPSRRKRCSPVLPLSKPQPPVPI
jgi:hypothetical protein